MEGNTENVCTICGTKVDITDCEHYICKECVLKWFEISSEDCVICTIMKFGLPTNEQPQSAADKADKRKQFHKSKQVEEFGVPTNEQPQSAADKADKRKHLHKSKKVEELGVPTDEQPQSAADKANKRKHLHKSKKVEEFGVSNNKQSQSVADKADQRKHLHKSKKVEANQIQQPPNPISHSRQNFIDRSKGQKNAISKQHEGNNGNKNKKSEQKQLGRKRFPRPSYVNRNAARLEPRAQANQVDGFWGIVQNVFEVLNVIHTLFLVGLIIYWCYYFF
ncbi:uncharacterized protein LOC119671729 [Teleopsis dalmanni]|uniref:uncharacterized protein LOC119671547 n=1 Tax=Teleopsis dalmanni TaxID=139649 RepID=UPI0018CE3D84|nr:uncharacterized protein LOC119671547 [Teleopsis dalmanni]XP_037938418.1 uncharacterized protein LOC119671729 [Teleopsis dalmanni]